MPTSTFFNLAPEKKERIFQASVKEFASRDFKDASINQIIRQAHIPRGSFYQYFSGKEDLYLYVLQRITEEKLEVYKRFVLPQKEDFFETTLAALPAIFQWIEEKPLYNQIGMRMVRDASDGPLKPLEKIDSSAQFLYGLLKRDQDNGKIRKGIDLNMVAQIFYTVSVQMIKDYYESGCSREVFTDKLQSFFCILKYGISD